MSLFFTRKNKVFVNNCYDPVSCAQDLLVFNSAERSLVHTDTLLKSPTTRQFVRLPFAIADVRRVKTDDLIGKNDKFGGQVRYAVTENTLTPGRISDTELLESIDKTGRGWVVEINNRIDGFAIGNARTGNVWALFVRPEC